MPRTDFEKDLERITALDAHQRGYQYQSFIGSLFKHYHYTVIPNAGTARPRQVDLLATRGDETYLVETKWRTDPANIDDVDSLFTRLDSTSSTVIGVLVSHTGFTKEVINRVIERANRPVLLVTGAELEQLVRYDEDFIQLLHQKKSVLLAQREVLIDSKRDRRKKYKAAPGSLLPADAQFVFLDGSRGSFLSCSGDFGQFTFVKELPDVDWVPAGGFGVSLDISIPAWEEQDIISLLHQLSDMGWSTPDACWSIQQMNTNWHGLGADSFVNALTNWKDRYKGIETHHTEEFCYFDAFDGGFYALTASVAAHKYRQVRETLLSFQLQGIPLDVDPLKHLCASFNVRGPAYFRPMDERAVTKNKGRRDGERLEPIAYVIELDNVFDEPTEWARGIVAKNPYYNPTQPFSQREPKWIPSQVFDSEYIICEFRFWHPLNEPRPMYKLSGCETTHAGDARIVRLIAEWGNPEDFTDKPGHAFRITAPPPKVTPVDVEAETSLAQL